jgi:hypothetical protein
VDWACQNPAQESESRESWMAKKCKPPHAFWWLPRLRPPDLFVCFSDRKHISTSLTPLLTIIKHARCRSTSMEDISNALVQAGEEIMSFRLCKKNLIVVLCTSLMLGLNGI